MLQNEEQREEREKYLSKPVVYDKHRSWDLPWSLQMMRWLENRKMSVDCDGNSINLQISEKQGCLDTGSSSKGGGTWPYTISQLMSSKSEDEHREDDPLRICRLQISCNM